MTSQVATRRSQGRGFEECAEFIAGPPRQYADVVVIKVPAEKMARAATGLPATTASRRTHVYMCTAPLHTYMCIEPPVPCGTVQASGACFCYIFHVFIGFVYLTNASSHTFRTSEAGPVSFVQ